MDTRSWDNSRSKQWREMPFVAKASVTSLISILVRGGGHVSAFFCEESTDHSLNVSSMTISLQLRFIAFTIFHRKAAMKLTFRTQLRNESFLCQSKNSRAIESEYFNDRSKKNVIRVYLIVKEKRKFRNYGNFKIQNRLSIYALIKLSFYLILKLTLWIGDWGINLIKLEEDNYV